MSGARGYCAVALHRPKTPENVGSALRAAACYGAALFAVSGQRFKRSRTDTHKAWRHMPVLEAEDLSTLLPHDCTPVAVELADGAVSLVTFHHPERAFYVFGPEDGSLPAEVLAWCKHTVFVPMASGCMNLAAAVNVTLYDREAKHVRG